MIKIKSNHWYVGNNELSISLLRYYVIISICQNNYQLKVYSESKVKLSLSFNSLKDAVEFTESVIQNNTELDKIEQLYNKMFVKEKIKVLI